MDKKLITKLVGIFTLIAAILAIPQFFIQYKEYKSEHGGHLAMYFMNNEIHNNEVRNIYICLSNSGESLSGISITPVFDNSSEYTIKDFDLRYTLESDGFLPQSNSLYEQIAFDNNSCMYKYQEKTLPQFSQTHEPFRLSSFPKVNSRYTLKAKATYSGAPCPYKYQVNVWIRVYPRKSNQSFDDWKMTCKQQLYQLNSQATVYDAFYASGDKFYHEFGNDFGPQYAASQNTQNTQNKPVQQATTPSKPVQQTTTPAPVTTPAKPVAQTKPVQQTTTPVSADEPLRIVSWEQTMEDSTAYLTVTFNKAIRSNTYYIVAGYEDAPYKRYAHYYLYGNNTNTVKDQLYYPNEHILYVCLPIEDESYKQYISFTDSDDKEYLTIKNESDSVLLVKQIFNDNSSYTSIVRIQSSATYKNGRTSSDIVSYETYLVPRYEGEIKEKKKNNRFEWITILVVLGSSLAALGFGMLFEEKDPKELLELKAWKEIDLGNLLTILGCILVGIILFVLGIVLWI